MKIRENRIENKYYENYIETWLHVNICALQYSMCSY